MKSIGGKIKLTQNERPNYRKRNTPSTPSLRNALSKWFNDIINDIITTTVRYRLEKWTIQWLENCLNCQAQKIVTCAAMSSWQLVTCGIFQGTILRPMLFNVFINELDDSMECTLQKFTVYSKLGGTVDKRGGKAANQEDLDSMQKWTCSNCKKFNKVQETAKSCNGD